MYVSNSRSDNTFTVSDNFVCFVPDYLYYSFSDSGFDITGTSFNEDSEGNTVEEGSGDSITGIDINDSTSSDSGSVSDQIQSLSMQIDNLNNNLVTMQEDNKILIGFVFCITFIIGIKMLYNIFSKVLGLGNC